MQIKHVAIIGLLLGLMFGGGRVDKVAAQALSCAGAGEAACKSTPGCTWDTSQATACSGQSESNCEDPCQNNYDIVLNSCGGTYPPCISSDCRQDTYSCSGLDYTTCAMIPACGDWIPGVCNGPSGCSGRTQAACTAPCGWTKAYCSGSYTLCNGQYRSTEWDACFYPPGGDCTGTPCACSWTGWRCNSSDVLQQCDGCNIVNVATCAQPLGCDYGDSTCEDKCTSNLALVNSSYVSLPMCTGAQTTSCPQITGKNVLQYNSCQYGCDSNTGLCRTKPATQPYCENTGLCNCVGEVCTQEVRCWPSYADFVGCKKLQSGSNPVCNPLYGYTYPNPPLVVETCAAAGCHPTNRWCVADSNPKTCPPASMLELTQKWKDTCGFVDCKDPDEEPCNTGTPPPTPPPGVTVPTCTVDSVAIVPNPPVIMSPVTITATVTTTVNTVDYVAFYVRNAAGQVVANGTGQDSDGTNGYTFSYTPPDASPFTVTATGVFSETGTVPCDRTTATVTPVPPTTTVNIRTYQVGVGVCNNPVALGGVPVELTRMDTDPEQVRSGTTNGSGLYSWPSVIGGNTTNYRLRATPPNYVYQACTNGTNPRDFNVPYSPAGSYSHDFYFTLMADPWFQIYHGDVGAAGGSISSLVSGDNNTFLAQLVANSSGVAMANGAVAANPVGPAGRLWQADGVNFSQVDYWYGYFMASFDQVFTQQDIEELSQGSFDDDIWDTHSEEGDSRVLWVSGDLAVNHDIDVPPGKWTIFVPGDLEIDAPGIVTEQGEYIAFVVRGNINFTDRTRQIQGVYVADGELTVENTTMDFGTGRQFEGQGIFIGQGGVTLQRDLNGSTLPDDDLANNTAAAQVFTYRPDFVINAPLGFLRSSVMWQEVAPGAVEPATPPEPELPPDQGCTNDDYQCSSPSISQHCVNNEWVSTTCPYGCQDGICAPKPPQAEVCVEGSYQCASSTISQHCVSNAWVNTTCPLGCQLDGRCATCVNEGGSCSLGQTCCNPLQCELGVCRSATPPDECVPPQTSPHYVEVGGECTEQLGCGYNDQYCL